MLSFPKISPSHPSTERLKLRKGTKRRDHLKVREMGQMRIKAGRSTNDLIRVRLQAQYYSCYSRFEETGWHYQKENRNSAWSYLCCHLINSWTECGIIARLVHSFQRQPIWKAHAFVGWPAHLRSWWGPEENFSPIEKQRRCFSRWHWLGCFVLFGGIRMIQRLRFILPFVALKFPALLIFPERYHQRHHC